MVTEAKQKYIQEYREANKDAISQQRKEWYKANKEAISQQRKEFREANKETISQQKKEWYKANKEIISQQVKKYYEANKEVKKQYQKEYNKCHSCKLFQTHSKTNYLCSYCNPTTRLREKTKEMGLKSFLENYYNVIHNQSVKIEGSCYNNFPDFMIHLPDKTIIIECDENAHKSYPNDCEIIRMNNIQFSLKSNVIWIRYNPDKKGIPQKTKQTILRSYIDYYTNSSVTNEIAYLFY